MEKQESMNIMNWGLPLPSRIARVIFSKLSISNLPTCRLVSKSWNHLVLNYAASPKLHLSNAILFSTVDYDPYTTGSPVISFHNPKIYCFDIDTLSFVSSCTFVGPEISHISIYNCCNGLFFIEKGDLKSECEGIFNPMTNEFFQTPIPELHYTLFHGFGFSLKTKQFKLFRANSGCELKILRFGRNHNQWTSVYLSSPITLASHGVYMNGVVYWIGKDKEKKYIIYALDVETENFEMIAVLEVGSYSNRVILQLFDATIYAIAFMSEPSQIEVWRMERKNSWIKDFIVPGEFRDTSISLLNDSGGKIFLRIINNLFCWNKFAGTKNKIKTLIACDKRFINSCCDPIDTLHFSSLPNILVGDD